MSKNMMVTNGLLKSIELGVNMFWLELWAMLQVIGMLVPVFLFLVFFAYILFQHLKIVIKQSRCKHEKYRENMKCDAICSECGKNLGFIGNVRKQKTTGSES